MLKYTWNFFKNLMSNHKMMIRPKKSNWEFHYNKTKLISRSNNIISNKNILFIKTKFKSCHTMATYMVTVNKNNAGYN